MGSSSSKHAYAFPVPMPAHDPSKSGKWFFSTKKKSKNGKEKYDDFIVPKYPTPATAAYGFPYYPQMQTTFPTYYAPVPMAVMQPFGVQQPVFAMPQGYVPMPTYQTTAAPVQPAVVPPVRPAPATQMPIPAPALASARTHAMQMPVPTPGPPNSSAPPPTAPTQMPQPHPIYDPPPHGPVMPPSPVLAEPVIPPPPNFNSEPHRPAPDSVRPRFTDFYRPVDMPDPPPRRPSFDEPVRPPTAGPSGRTPFVPPMQMPTPMPIPMSNNPLPPPPADVWDNSPYRQVLENLPNELPPLLDLHPYSDSFVSMPEPVPRPSSRLGGLFGSTSRRDKGKNPLRGLFRSRSTSGHDVQNDLGSIGGSQHGHGRAQTMTTFLIPAPGTSTSTMDIPSGVPSTSMPVPDLGPPIRFDHTGHYAGFVNHSNHRVMYKNKMYPTALHLLEAMKFIHQPALQERIRTCKDVNDMYPLSASYQEHVRSDWGQVFLQTMEDVLYLKFKQHPSLRMLLLRTGLVDIVYADDNDYWGEGPLGEGANELGKALVRVRERLQQEGER